MNYDEAEADDAIDFVVIECTECGAAWTILAEGETDDCIEPFCTGIGVLPELIGGINENEKLSRRN